MKITEINVIPLYPRLAERYARRKVDLYGIDARTVFKIQTDKGITGYGDQRVRPVAQSDALVRLPAAAVPDLLQLARGNHVRHPGPTAV